MAFDMQLSGLKKRIANMQEMVGHRAIDMINELSGIGESQAKNLAQVASGELRDSIHMVAAEIKEDQVEGSFGTNNDHAIFVEYGTGQRGMSGGVANGMEKDPDPDVSYRQDWPGMRAYPFMYPASKLVAEVAPDILQKHAKKISGGE